MTSVHAVNLTRYTLILLILLTSVLAGAGAFAPVRAGAPVLVIAPPWAGGPAAVLAQAGGQEISPVRAPFAAMGVFDNFDDVWAAGAWAVWDAGFFMKFCGISPHENRS